MTCNQVSTQNNVTNSFTSSQKEPLDVTKFTVTYTNARHWIH